MRIKHDTNEVLYKVTHYSLRNNSISTLCGEENKDVICVSGFLAVSLLLLLTATAGDPTVKVKDAEYSQDSKRMLEISLKQVQVTIKHYRERIHQAEPSGEFALSEVLRDIIAQELNRLRNRSERCPQIMMIIDRLGINQCIPVVRADNCSCC